jgi:cell division protease FtsH
MFKKLKNLFDGWPIGIISFIFGFLFLLMILSKLIDNNNSPKILSHSEFVNSLNKGEIKYIKVEDDHIKGKFIDNRFFEATVHMTDKIWDLMYTKNIDVVISSDSSNSGFDGWYILLFGIVISIIIAIWITLRRNKNSNNGGGMSSIFSIGKSRFKKTSPGEGNIKFADVAGAKNAKEALTDIVDFLKNPEKFKLLGARIPKGILLAGEPGNGKTLLARALAGEANCTFLNISGADFIEVFVGVGAARIRDLFGQARKSAPCILFIDEIDAIGRTRGSGFGGGHDEREQTLNQLLTEMDGFDQYELPLVVIAATNIPEVLDKALLRPGRFDRVVYVPYPDFAARLELLKIHTSKTPLKKDIDLESIARFTQGLSGADIENLVNMAALKASQSGSKSLTKEDFEKAYKDLVLSKRDIQISSQEKAKEFLPQQVKTKFEDIAGLEDAKEDLKEVVDFLKNPQKYLDIGARVPRGILMSGDPGNGKTMLARAVAGESAVPFFYASGSQFIQKYVGVGAERIRDLFTQARKHSPSIIFIDELDSIGSRSSDSDGGNREYNQTINQLLTEMDGFVQNEIPVIVVAATNMKDSIDSALKRAGRFDRHVFIPYPNMKARIKILQVHSKGKKFDETVQIETIGKGTPGFSGAALENLLNEAAILAVSRGKEFISMSEIDEAKDRLILGKKNTGLTRKQDEIKKTAYHEAGHALTSILQSDYPYSFHKVTILSRGGALGVSQSLPKDDETGFSKEQLESLIVVSLAGRAAEQIIFDHIHTGAYSDFKNATSIAEKMVIAYGMITSIGIVSYVERKKISPETSREIDLAIKNLLDVCYKKALDLLTSNKDKLEKIANALIEKETLESNDVYEIAGIAMPLKEENEL